MPTIGIIRVFSASTSRPLAEGICKELGTMFGSNHITEFADGETCVWIEETVRGQDCFVVQSTCKPVDNNLMELLVTIDALRRASAGRITAVIPYFGYARQDRKSKGRDPITAKLVANMIVAAGAHRVLTMDLHAPQIQGFFDIPVDHLLSAPFFVDAYRRQFAEQGAQPEALLAVAPDVGSVVRTRAFASRLGIGIAIVDKHRDRPNQAKVMNIIGDVAGKTCILIDDIVDTANTLCNAAAALKDIGGAKEVYACAPHGVLSGDACRIIEDSCIRELAILNTIPLPANYDGVKIKQLDAAELFGRAIRCINENASISALFKYELQSNS